MATGLGEFGIRYDGGELVRVIASKWDYIVTEREMRQPVYKAVEDGYLEPILRLAFTAARNAKAIPAGATFEEFLQNADVEFEAPDDAAEEAPSGNE